MAEQLAVLGAVSGPPDGHVFVTEAKRRDAPYRSGDCRDWHKVKTSRGAKPIRSDGEGLKNGRLGNVEPNTLCERKRFAVVDGVGGSPHIGFPSV